ncbi:hypothetical protein [Acidisphaera sp. L21]|uniref:hypothetical protein n=1 Tax=Acidisphaera sp. L21 TaxID=1641851 RepID=UPI00131B8FAD|nr:hypothetical protein [Acidisphaera sp. L21]
MTVCLRGALRGFVQANTGEDGVYESFGATLRDLIRRDEERAERAVIGCLKLWPAVWSLLGPMQRHPSPSDETVRPPAPFRARVDELVDIGMSVARLVGRAAEAEMDLADAAASVAEGASAIATSLAEAIAADEAAAAAGEARRDVVDRTVVIAAAFAKVSRAIRQTILLAERLDRGWARPGGADDRHAMARRQIARVLREASARDADGEAAERLESLDAVDEIGDPSIEALLRDICRVLGVDPAPFLARCQEPQAAAPVVPERVPPPGGRARARCAPIRERPT